MAGAAALVIQAYRQTHGGATPTPALVKQILVSTATDLGAPAIEQGAGLLNSYKAVQLAESIKTSDGSPAATGTTLLKSVNAFSAVSNDRRHDFRTTITNTGTSTENVSISGRQLGPNQNVQSGSVTLTDGTSPTFTNFSGLPNNYGTFTFNVPAGQARLEADRCLPGQPGQGQQPAGPPDPDRPDREVRCPLAAAGRR